MDPDMGQPKPSRVLLRVVATVSGLKQLMSVPGTDTVRRQGIRTLPGLALATPRESAQVGRCLSPT